MSTTHMLMRPQFSFIRFYLQTNLSSSNKREDNVIYSDTDALHKDNVNNRHVFRSSRPLLLQHLHVHPKRFLDGVFGDETDEVCGVGVSVRKKFVYGGLSHHRLTYLTGMICGQKNSVHEQNVLTIPGRNIVFCSKLLLFTWDGQPFSHGYSSCAENFIFRNKLIHQTDLQGFRSIVQ